ncbi:MAG: sigma-54-dependent Fis family transcriptional regulator [Peptococcaceae bacterium]|nr:sigma-54-dependent Fis family transcriptional regulator [Peptococcaceae bacterium]
MKLSQNRVKEIWEKMLKGDFEEYGLLRPELQASWRRCLQYKVDPYSPRIPVIGSHELLARKMRLNELIDISLPVMKNLYDFVKNSGFIVVLADTDGILIETMGDQEIIDSAKGVSFIPGSDWSEESAGTNAVGTVLKTCEPIQIIGCEHFCQGIHNWTCSAATIREPDGNIIGVLDMSGHVENVHLHTLGMVVAAVYAIENQMLSRRAWKNLEISNNYKNTIIESINEGLLAVDPRGLVSHVNMVAAGILGKNPEEIINNPVSIVLGERNKSILNIILNQGDVTDREVNIYNSTGKTTCLLTSRAIGKKNKNEGTVVLFNEIARARKLVQHMSGSEARLTFSDIIGQNEKFMETVRLARAISGSISNVLLLGESGTGKDLFAQAIHNGSARGNGPFVAINCGAIPRELIASELFGYSEGSFTGAKRGGKPGKFELANGGTIFLDEIGEMPLQLQTILLRAIEQKNITRIGGHDLIPVDVRIIAATNKNLQEEVVKGNFRQDLYYRLNVVRIDLVPLRERPEDIPLLIDHFVKNLCSKLKKTKITQVDAKVIKALRDYHWPGNIRELQNILERAVNVCQGSVLALEHLPSDFRVKEPGQALLPVELYEKEMIGNLLKKYNNNMTRVASELGVSRSTLYRKLDKFKLRVT